MKIEIALSSKNEAWFLSGAALLFVIYSLMSQYGDTILSWFEWA